MFQPRHTHPFSPEEALLLDPPTITAEVARLRHSVDHLRQSNDALRDFLAAEGFDREIATARDENERTMSVQTLRIVGCIFSGMYSPGRRRRRRASSLIAD